MTDRDRLIELFNEIEKDPAVTCPHYKTDKTCDTCKYTINNFMCNHTERTVDYLLANGVIVLPCKVGDVVYIKNRPLIISFLHIENEVHYVIQFDCDDCGDCPFYEDDVSFEGEHDCKTMGYIQFTEKDIGKTVFLTKEEAEEKLKEREEK